jgi:hypothetical protein
VTFQEARDVLVPFGKFQGVPIDKVAYTDDGLRYLDWLRGKNLYGRFKEALDTYLTDPSIVRELESARET